MASSIQTQMPYAPPTFARNDSSSTVPTMMQHAEDLERRRRESLSQAHMASFESAPSISSTPAPTPPPPRSSSQQAMYTISGPPMVNGMGTHRSFPSYGSTNGFPPQMQYQQLQPPQIYTAVYSNVSVYEMEVNGVAVMRRRSDGWLNATQILKVAGVDKGKRTKVLEKEILTGKHEKVQGGYGKYQGTWIDYNRGREFCRQYGVEDLLRPLLDYDMAQDGAVGLPGNTSTPTKEQAMAAQRKRLYNGIERPSTQNSNEGTFFKNLSATAANAVNAIHRARYDSPAKGLDGRRSTNGRRPSNHQYAGSQESIVPSGSQQSLHSIASDTSFGGNNVPNGTFTYPSNYAEFPSAPDPQEPPRKRMRPSQNDSFMSIDPGLENSGLLGSPTEPNMSFFSQNNDAYHGTMDGTFGLEPLPTTGTAAEEERRQVLINLFLEPNRSDFSDHPAFLTLTGEEMEHPIDGSCNTALHWAAALARIDLVKQLLRKGVSMRRTNSGGETALIQACRTRNNMDHLTFKELLKLLGPTIEVRDGRGRTVLHHIAVSSAMKGRAQMGLHYLMILLEYVVQSSSQPSSQESSVNGFGGPLQNEPRSIDLARFMSEVVNAQDKSGDTALYLAARSNTTAIVRQLIEVGADPHVPNSSGLAPVDFGVRRPTDSNLSDINMSFDAPFAPPNNVSQSSFVDAENELMNSIQEILNTAKLEFANEQQQKQERLDQVNAQLKDASSALRDERQQLEDVKARDAERNELQRKVLNLERANLDVRNQLRGREIAEDVRIGDADKGLDLEGNIPLVEELFPDDMDLDAPLNQAQLDFLSNVERAEVQAGRVHAYEKHNGMLEAQLHQLKKSNVKLEETYRKIITACLGIPEDKIDEKLPALLQALQSEEKEQLDVDRVREFLRMWQTVEM